LRRHLFRGERHQRPAFPAQSEKLAANGPKLYR
jgi:hypothetical protein